MPGLGKPRPSLRGPRYPTLRCRSWRFRPRSTCRGRIDWRTTLDGWMVTAKSRILRTSGFCCMCDSRFSDELVLAVPDDALPTGWAYYELRHLPQGRGFSRRDVAPAR